MASKALARWGRSVDRTQSRPSTPHRTLMVAVLKAAIEDARDAAERTGAMAWVTSTDRCWPFSFENICLALDMDPGAVRRELERDVVLARTNDDLG